MTAAQALPYVAFFLVCAALMLLAFRPAWQEWRSPTDSEALSISPNDTKEIDYFAHKFREEVIATFSGALSPGGRIFAHVPQQAEHMDWAGARRPLISFEAVRLNQSVNCQPPLFVNDDIESAGGDVFSAVFATGTLTLGAYSEIQEWAHADGSVRIGESSVALRRISSAVAIELDEECCFERVNAPVVRFGLTHAASGHAESTARVESSYIELPGAIRRTANLTMIKGDCVLPEGRIYHGSLVVTGCLTIGRDTTIVGDVKGRKDVVVGAGSVIRGSLVSERQVSLLEHVQIDGPLVSETDILIGTGSRIGAEDRPTTVTADNIIVELGAVAHGTVWARKVGTVWAA